MEVWWQIKLTNKGYNARTRIFKESCTDAQNKF